MIHIEKAKEIREDLKLTHLIIFGVDEKGCQHVATHGKSKRDALLSANMGNHLKKRVELAF